MEAAAAQQEAVQAGKASFAHELRNELVAELIAEGRKEKLPRAREMALKELGARGADGEKRAADERSRSKVEARQQKAPLEEADLSEKRPPSSQQRNGLRSPQTEEGSKMVWHPEELDGDKPLGWGTRIVSQAGFRVLDNACPA